MYNLDSLTLKYLINENKNFLNNSVVQKIQMPSRREILLSLRNLGQNLKLYINLNPKFPHLNLIENKENYFFKIPSSPPMFCMLLRKHLEGAKINEVRVVEFERIVEFYFNICDEIGSETPMCLALEFMGKHSNAILYNAKTKIIQGCVHNISPEKSSVREVWGGIPYVRPPKQEKRDLLKTSAGAFYSLSKEEIKREFYYLTGGLTDYVLNSKKETEFFPALQKLLAEGNETVKDFWKNNLNQEGEPFFTESLNGLIEAYFSRFVMQDLIETRKKAVLKSLKKELKRQEDILSNSDSCDKYPDYKEKGNLILQNIYLINKGDEKFKLNDTVVELDPLLSPSENAQKYFSLYSKGKTAKEIKGKRCEEALKIKEYLDEILFTAENADAPDILDEIEEEFNGFMVKLGRTKEQQAKSKEKPNVKKLEFKGFEIYVGKNNKQNDFIIRKLSNPEDLWFHAQNCPSGHILVKTENGKKEVPNEVLEFASKLTKQNSPMKEVSKASVIYTKRKYLKRPPETHLGYVTYSHEKEIVI